jgi:hypothetical protein
MSLFRYILISIPLHVLAYITRCEEHDEVAGRDHFISDSFEAWTIPRGNVLFKKGLGIRRECFSFMTHFDTCNSAATCAFGPAWYWNPMLAYFHLRLGELHTVLMHRAVARR